MKIKQYVTGIIFLITLLASTCSMAAVPAWKMISDKSNLSFTATQNGAPVTGQFKTFSGEINFDPNQLDASHIYITVEMGSVSDAYHKLSETLKSLDWFDVKSFPQAVFKSNQFIKTGDKNYEAKGTLTIRDKTIPVTLVLILDEYSANTAKMRGNTTIKRTAFGVGQGEWADTQLVKDDVQIHFVVNAVKK